MIGQKALTKVLAVLILSAVFSIIWLQDASAEGQLQIPANEILDMIEGGQPVSIRNVAVVGDLDIDKMELPIREDDGIKRKVIESEILIEDCTLYGNTNFKSVYFNAPVSFYYTRFSGFAHFEDSVFSSDASFASAEFIYRGSSSFDCSTDFENASFYEDASFCQAGFDGEAYFWGATFKGFTDFEGAYFCEDASFCQAGFNGEAYFWGATFKGPVNFKYSVFSSDASFAHAEFEYKHAPSWFEFSADFERATFYGNTNFDRVHFNGPVNFEDSVFSNDASFEYAEFVGETYFWGATFNGSADFENVQFSKGAAFSGGTFDGPAFFYDAWFGEGHGGEFAGATFNGDAEFAWATFDNADFRWVAFNGDTASFLSSTFNKWADFLDVTFNSVTDFSYTTFNSWVHFNGARFNRAVHFYDANFYSDIDFSGADLNNVNISWRQIEGKVTYNRQVYQAFIRNFDELGQFDDADEAYYTYMVEKRGHERAWYNPARWLEAIVLDYTCGYGVKPLRVILFVIVTLLLFSCCYYQRGAMQEREGPNLTPMSCVRRERFIHALYFSLANFIGASYGIWYPSTESLTIWRINFHITFRALAIIERLLGWFALALFLVTLARVWIR